MLARSLGASFATVAALSSGSGSAQDFPFKSVILLKGTCERLMLPTVNLTSTCKSTHANMLYPNGRSSFAFTDGDRSMISFTGMGQQVSGDKATQPVDHVTIAMSHGTDVKDEVARGACEFSNAYKGKAFVRCTATTKSGEFIASFQTDGSPPDVQKF